MIEYAPADSFVNRRIEAALSDEAVKGRVKTLFLDDDRLDFGEDQLVELIMKRHKLVQASAVYVMNQCFNGLIQNITGGA